MIPKFAKLEIRELIKEGCVKCAMDAYTLKTHVLIHHGILISAAPIPILHTHVEWQSVSWFMCRELASHLKFSCLWEMCHFLLKETSNQTARGLYLHKTRDHCTFIQKIVKTDNIWQEPCSLISKLQGVLRWWCGTLFLNTPEPCEQLFNVF